MRDQARTCSDAEVTARLMRTVSRAVAQQDVVLARRLVREHTDVAEHLCIDRGAVGLKDARAFAQHLGTLQSAHLERDRSAKDQARVKRGSSGVDRLVKLWTPFDKRLILRGVRVEGSGRVVSSARDVMCQLGAAWGRVFSQPPGDPDARRSLLAEHSVDWGCGSIPPPSAQDFERAAARASPTASGPDGVPYVVWAVPNCGAGALLSDVFFELASGRRPPLWFNRSLGVFIPKGDDEGDDEGPVRAAGDTRPLSLRNSDSKVLASVVNHKVAGPAALAAHPSQRGFIRGRQLTANIVELDTHSRAASFLARRAQETDLVAALFDFLAAFPSVCQAFMLEALARGGFHGGQCAFVAGLYADASVWVGITGDQEMLYWVRSGIVQGCPLSGLLFVVTVDPVLRMLDAALRAVGRSVVCACADDIGAVCYSKTHLLAMRPPFLLAARAARLCLKPAKCQLVLLGSPATPAEVDRMRRWIAEAAPEWERIGVTDSACYLGAYLGPAAGAQQWVKPMRKWMDRAVAIAASGAPAGPAARMY